MAEIRIAVQSEHAAILAIAKQSRWTRDFGSNHFSGEAAYLKGWIRVSVAPFRDEVPTGFYCVRHKVRSPVTVLYFLGVSRELRRAGLGEALLQDLVERSPHPLIELACAKVNEEALRFYQRRGFVIAGEALDGTGYRLTREKT